jgi:hypothetical protein
MKKSPKTSNPQAFELAAAAKLAFAEAEEGKAPKRPTFDIDAYSGGPLRLWGFGKPVVIDLSGLRSRAKIPVLLDHDSSQIVGQANEVNIGRDSIRLSGVVTGSDAPAQKVIDHAKGGLEWQASVGVSIDRLESIDGKTDVNVNGRAMTGPLFVVRAGRLGEVSFVAIGADESASARVAASAAGDKVMDFNEWLKAKGFEPEQLTEEQKKTLQAAFEAEQEKPGDAEPGKTATAAGGSDITAEMRTTTNNYWLQCTQLRAAADPDDPDEPPATDLKEGDVFLAINLMEQLTGTHGLRVGEEVLAWQQGDSAGNSRWVFCG